MPSFFSEIKTLWLRLSTVAVVGVLFAEALFLGKQRIQGWTFYLTTSEVVFEVVVRLLFGALAGILLGTILTALAAPFLSHFRSSRDLLISRITNICVVVVLFIDTRYALLTLIQGRGHGPRFRLAALAAHFAAFVIGLALPRTRKELFGSLDMFLGRKASRGLVYGTVAATLLLVLFEFGLSRSAHTTPAEAATMTRPKSNIVLITFDAFTAEEMSLYGYKQPTTPELDAFAKNSTVFTNYYAGSTSTTPCIGVIFTGGYPTESHVYGLGGQLPSATANQSLATVMTAGGYSTGAFLTNPWAYYLAQSAKNGFEVLPEPVFDPGAVQRLWNVARPLHQDSRFGSRVTEFFDLEILWDWIHGREESPAFRIRPDASFQGAEQVLNQLDDGFFLWVHLIAPHHPYLPDTQDQGRYIPQSELLSFKEEPWELWKPSYDPSVQPQVDRRRLAYDEYIQSTDRAFGEFIQKLEQSGKLKNTTVIVSADHGESFEGGVYQHETPYLTRPVIHLPLMIRTPGQQGQRTVSYVADQTALAPTIVDVAGLSKPSWMHGESLVPWLKGNDLGEGKGLAFTQYLERNSVFRPLHHGSMGVIDSKDQYVFYLDTMKGQLRPLDRAEVWNLDTSSEDPAKAEALRAALHNKFPDAVPVK